MTRSTLSYAELCAQAMLLGMQYDPRDHSFNDYPGRYICADTLQPIWPMLVEVRRGEVCDGVMGAWDLSYMTEQEREALWHDAQKRMNQ